MANRQDPVSLVEKSGKSVAEEDSESPTACSDRDARSEEARIAALESLDLLDTPESESFDRITRMASHLFRAPISAVSLTDRHRQWFKSHVGTQGRQIPRDGAPCAAVTRSAAPLVIPDMLANAEFADCLLAKSGIRFYAGSPLTTRDGYVLGAMCVLDSKPRTITPGELASLNDLAAMVMSQIELEHDFGRVDPLSGLPNRHQFGEDLDDEERQNSGHARVVLLIDLVDPNQLRDSVNVLGTAFIDNVVSNSTRIIKSVLGRKQGIYHVGTSSFAVFLRDEDGVWPDVVDRLFKTLNGQVISEGIPVTTDPSSASRPFESAKPDPGMFFARQSPQHTTHGSSKSGMPFTARTATRPICVASRF